MTNSNNHSVQVFWVALSSLSNLVMAILSTAILSRILDKTEYGTYRQIIYVYSSLLVIFSAGLPNIFSYFLPKITLEEGKQLTFKVTLLLLGLGALFGLFLYIGAPAIAKFYNNNAMQDGLRIFFIIPVLLLPTLGIDGIFASYRKTHLLAIFNIINKLVLLLCIIVPVYLLEPTCTMALKGWVAGSAFTLILALFFKNIPFKNVRPVQGSVNFRQVFAYSIPLVLASIWGMAIRYADQFYISHFFGTETYAEFMNGFIEIPFAAIITGSIATILTPLISGTTTDNILHQKTIQLWIEALKKSALLLYPLVTFFIFFGFDTMTTVYSEKYYNSGHYFKINIFLNYFNIIMFSPVFYGMGKVRLYSNLHLIFAVLAWVIGYILILIFNHPFAIAYLSTAIQVMFIVVSVWLVKDLLKQKITDLIPFGFLLMVLGHTIFAGFLSERIIRLLEIQSDFFRLIGGGVIFISILLVSDILLKLNYLSVVLNPVKDILKRKVIV